MVTRTHEGCDYDGTHKGCDYGRGGGPTMAPIKGVTTGEGVAPYDGTHKGCNHRPFEGCNHRPYEGCGPGPTRPP